jgi:hypothetical protein
MEKSKQNPRPSALIIAGLIMSVCLFVLFGVLILNGTLFGISLKSSTPAGDQAASFMKALQEEDYAQAFTLCSPGLQKRLGNPAGLQQAIESAAAQPKAWKFTQPRVEGNKAIISGTFLASREGTLTLNLSQAESQWQVAAFEFGFK